MSMLIYVQIYLMLRSAEPEDERRTNGMKIQIRNPRCVKIWEKKGRERAKG
jgi:hypothetical protein